MPDIFGNSYKIGRMNALDQFHVMRRLHSLAAAAGRSFDEIQRAGGASALEDAVKERKPSGKILDILAPILRAVGEMRQEDVDYVFEKCLSVVERQTPGGAAWAPVWGRGGMMFNDIGMPGMIVLVWHVLVENLGDFFSDLLSGLTALGMMEPGSNSSAEKTTGS